MLPFPGNFFAANIADPLFDSKTTLPSHFVFPKASVPWLKCAAYSVFGLLPAWLFVVFARELLSLDRSIISIGFYASLISIVCSFAWWWYRITEINTQIAATPWYHFGRPYAWRGEYKLGEELTDEENEACLMIASTATHFENDDYPERE